MTKEQLMDEIIGRTKPGDVRSKAAAGRIADAVFDALKDELVAGKEVCVSGFGTFYLLEKDAHTARKPSDGSAVDVPAKRFVRFRMAKKLSDQMNT